MRKLIIRIKNKLPKYYKNVWYNQSAYISKCEYPIIFTVNGSYINCEIGLEVIMGKTQEGKNIYYKVIKKWRTKGSDFFSPSDAINCDLKFSHIK